MDDDSVESCTEVKEKLTELTEIDTQVKSHTYLYSSQPCLVAKENFQELQAKLNGIGLPQQQTSRVA